MFRISIWIGILGCIVFSLGFMTHGGSIKQVPALTNAQKDAFEDFQNYYLEAKENLVTRMQTDDYPVHFAVVHQAQLRQILDQSKPLTETVPATHNVQVSGWNFRFFNGEPMSFPNFDILVTPEQLDQDPSVLQHAATAQVCQTFVERGGFLGNFKNERITFCITEVMGFEEHAAAATNLNMQQNLVSEAYPNDALNGATKALADNENVVEAHFVKLYGKN